MPGERIRLLALDGGGLRGLSSLFVLRSLMQMINPESPPKPCECFHMIGGTSTGGLIAIMLGRLRMTVDECIEAYTSLSDKVFRIKSQAKIKGQARGRLDAAELEVAIKRILQDLGLDENELLMDDGASCRVFVCATIKKTFETICLTSYRYPRSDNSDLLKSVKIWQACRATVANTFIDHITIGPFDDEFVNGAPKTNNPIHFLWNQAQGVWGDQLPSRLQCVVSIGTGVANVDTVLDDAPVTRRRLIDTATETERIADEFRRDNSRLDDEGRYYRFNVSHGLEEVGLEESKMKNEVEAATRRYVESQDVLKQMQACANNLTGRQYHGPYRTEFSLQGAPVSNHFVDRPSDMAVLEQGLLPHHSRSRRSRGRNIFVLHGLGGIGKTHLVAEFARRHRTTFSSVFWLDGSSEDRLRQSLAGYANKMPYGQIPDRSRKSVPSSEEALNMVVEDMLDWLARPDNVDWLLIVDSVATGVFDVRRYLRYDHGSVIITTRLSRLAQLGNAMHLMKANENLSRCIFERWYRGELVMDATGRELLGLLDGLPLALAQAASYCRHTGLDIRSYVRLYRQQWDDSLTSDTKSGSLSMYYNKESFGKTWSVSFKAIESRSRSAANLLRLWAFMANKDLWYGLLQAATFTQDRWPEWLREIAYNEAKFLDTVNLLVNYSMIEVQESEQGSYNLRPVVHSWLSHIQDSSERAEFLRLAIALLGLSLDIQDNQRRLLPHIEDCSRWMKDSSTPKWILDDKLVIDSIHNLGAIHAGQGRLDEAEVMYERALQGKETALGSDDISTMRTVEMLGALSMARFELPEAEAMFQRALRGKEKALGTDHPSTLATVENIRRLYEYRDEHDDSERTASELASSNWFGQESLTRPSSLSHGASIHREEATQIRQSFTVTRYQESVLKQEICEDEDDIQSVVSASDSIGSMAGSRSGTAIHWQAAVDSYVSMLAGNPELLALFQGATTSMQRDRFVRNHLRLLKHFFLGLSSETHTPSQQSAVEFLRSRRRRAHISHEIWSLVQPSDNTIMEKITMLNERDKDKKILVDRFLQEKDAPLHPAAADTADTPLPVPDHSDTRSESSESTAGDDDESSDEDEAGKQNDPALPKLQATAEFLTSGQPFILYKEKLREFLHPTPVAVDLQDEREPVESGETNQSKALPEEADNQRKDQTEAPVGRVHHDEETTRFPRTLSAWIDRAFSMLPFPFSEPPVPPGKTRIRWKCSCGESLYDDFVEVRPGGLQALQTRLRELNGTENVDQADHQSARDHWQSMRQGLQALITWMHRLAPVKKAQTANNEDNGLPLHARTADPRIDPAHSQEVLHILMCIDKGDHWTRLYQERLPSFNDDRHLFVFLREQYKEHRRSASWFTLKGIGKLSLVKFTVDNNSFANIQNHDLSCQPAACVCIPPLEKIDSNEYQCQTAPRVPPGVIPVIGSNLLTHYFLNPNDFKLPQRWIIDQLPKRACGQLALSPTVAQIGWGVHFKEGWNWSAIFYIIVVVLIGGLVFGAVWSRLTHDIASAFAITAILVALGPTLLGYIAARNVS